MTTQVHTDSYYELSYYIPRIHNSITENDIKRVISNTNFDNYRTLPTPTRIDFNEITNNKYFKSAFVYHDCYNKQDIEIAKKVKLLIQRLSNNDNNQELSNLNLKISCSLVTPNNPNAYWILLPNHNHLTLKAKMMADILKDIGSNVCTLLYILAYANVHIPNDIELSLEEKTNNILTPEENEYLIADKLQKAIDCEEKLENLVIQNNLILPEDLKVLYLFENEEDVINIY
jgi:hypothetical protein